MKMLIIMTLLAMLEMLIMISMSTIDKDDRVDISFVILFRHSHIVKHTLFCSLSKS